MTTVEDYRRAHETQLDRNLILLRKKVVRRSTSFRELLVEELIWWGKAGVVIGSVCGCALIVGWALAKI